MTTTSKRDKPKQAGIWAQSTSRKWDARGKRQTHHRIRQQSKKEFRREW